MNLGLTTPIEIQTRLTRAEVIERLRRSVDEPRWWPTLFGSIGMVGRIGPESCWFENGSSRRRVVRQLRLRYQEMPTGTMLTGKFVIPAFPAFVLTFFFLFSALTGVVALTYPFRQASDWRFLLVSFGTPLIGFAILKFSLWMAQRPEAEVVETLEEILKGPSRVRADGFDPFAHGEILIRPKVRQPRDWKR